MDIIAENKYGAYITEKFRFQKKMKRIVNILE